MRLIHTEPLENVIAREIEGTASDYIDANAYAHLVKAGGIAATTNSLSGELYASKSGWILLSVPNALARGAFDALDEAGIELPTSEENKFNAHISVMRPEELEQIGGIDKITERGHHFHYTLGPIQTCAPDGWGDISKVWFIKVNSPELQDLRKSYGLSPRPNNSQYDFHITIAVRRKSVLRHNDVIKAATQNQEGSNQNGMLETKDAEENRGNEEVRAGHSEGGSGIGGEEGLWCSLEETSDGSPTITKIAAYYEARSAIRAITGASGCNTAD